MASLGKLIDKPSLTEDRLKKPPFRFIRDIVASLQKATGFPAGLFTDEEMDVDNLKDKPQRVAWMKKILDATAYTTGEAVSANPSKVVGGSDAEQTNEWLVLLAKAATAPKGDQEKGVKKALAKADGKSEKKKDKDGDEKKDKKEGKDGKTKDKEGKEGKEGKDKEKTKKDKDEPKDKEKSKEGKDGKKEGKDRDKDKDKKKDAPEAPPEPIDPHAAMAAKLRPSTSRAGPPIKKDAVERVDATAESVSAQPTAQGVIRGGGAADDSEEEEREIDFDAQHIREDAAALGAGKGGGEGYMAQLAQQDIESARAKIQVVREGEEEEGLILTGTRKAKTRSTFDDEVHRMRQALQQLVNSTQPLGKAMDYVQEDIDSMARELNLLRNETTQQNVLFLEQQKATDDATAPFYNKLKDLDADISEQLQRTVLLKANIVANDETVRVLLRMVVMPDME